MKGVSYRFYIVIFILLASIYVILPTFVSNPKIAKFLPDNKIRLGLDLKGGTYLVLSVDLDRVILENTDRYVEHLKDIFKDKKINFKTVSRVDDKPQIKIVLESAKDKEEAKKIIGRDSSLRYISGDENTMVIGFTDRVLKYIKRRAVDQTIEAIRNRIDEFGVSEPSIVAQGQDRIVVQLPGIKDVARAKKIIGRVAKLEFKLVVENPDYNQAKLEYLVEEAKKNGIIYQKGRSYLAYVEKLNKFLKGKIPQDTVLLFQKKVLPNGDVKLTPYLLEKKTIVSGEHLADAYVGMNQFNEPEVIFRMNTIGSKLFGELTGKNIGRRLAIVLDKNVYSAPVIQSRITSSGRITLDRTKPYEELQKEAHDLALVLRAGALPTQLTFEEERTVGPTLGSDSVKQGKQAILWAFVLVILFMLFYYRLSGLIADIALFMNVLIIFSILVMFDAVLTLPGIAGIVLTVGMSVDANVIIFERIREELRLGTPIKTAVFVGYSKALSTILDANITTMIAGVILLQYGTGPIKGFAVTLLVGILSSVFTAVYISKWIFEWYLNKFNPKKLSI